MILCEYGCGKEAKFQFKNRKWCCSKSKNSCSEIKKKNSISNSGKNFSKETRDKMSFSRRIIMTKDLRNRISNSLKGRKLSLECIEKIKKSRIGYKHSEETKKKIGQGNRGKKNSIEVKQKISNKLKGRKLSKEFKQKRREWMLNGGADYLNSFPRKGFKNHKEWMLNGGADYLNSFPVRGYKNNKEWMLNEGASYTNKFIKNPSKLELKLREIVKELYPNCKPQHPVFNYALDVALVEHKISIEYDGWYHFDTEEHKEYHKLRQERIEEEGWKFIRYNIFQKFPSREQVKQDILKVLI